MEKSPDNQIKQRNSIVFSILIPSWNNLSYLKLCIQSIRKYSAAEHQLVVHVNEGTDGTVNWLKQEQIDFTQTTKNVGVCKALNKAYTLAKHDYIVYMNDDIVVLPGWDVALIEMIQRMPDDAFYFSSTMIEPVESGNPCVLAPYDFGRSPDSFNEELLLKKFRLLQKSDWCGATWPPSLVHRQYWEKVGGYSEEFSPGLYSDPDFSRKLWQVGVRYFVGVANSRVYHFMSKSTGRITPNNGRKQFAQKWGMTASFFKKHYLHLGEPWNGQPLPEPSFILSTIFQRFRSKFM